MLERLDPSDGRPVLRSRERLEALDERDEHRAHEPRGIPRSALAQHAEIQKMWAAKGEDVPRKPGHASRMTGRVDRRLALTMR